MNPNRWGVENPMVTEFSTKLDEEIHQTHEQDDLVADASSAQKRRFIRIEFTKAILVTLGGGALTLVILTILGVILSAIGFHL